MFLVISEAYHRVWDNIPPHLRRAILFGLGIFFVLSAVMGGSPLSFASKIAS